MQIEKAAIIGKGAVGLLYGGLIASNIGPDAVEFVMDDERFRRHANDRIRINGDPCEIKTVPASEAKPVDLVILAIKATGMETALRTMESCVGPQTRIISLLNGITSEERIAERFGWNRLVFSVAQGMDAVYIGTEHTYTHSGQIRFGAASHTDEGVVDEIADFFARAGIDFVVEDDICHRMWTKLMMNVGLNQTCMVWGNIWHGHCRGRAESQLIAAMRETMAVARAEGVELESSSQMVALTESSTRTACRPWPRPHQQAAERG
ncbi:MAG: ketopantoate reductase family protein [Slackia sp.]